MNQHQRKNRPATSTPGLGDPQPFSPWRQSWGQEGCRGKAPQGNASPDSANSRCSKQRGGGDGWKWGAACKLRFGWVSCEGLGGQQAGEHRGENFASLCRLMTRAGVSDQEARSPGGLGRLEARAIRGQPAGEVRDHLVSGLPRTKLSATAFQGSKKKEVCVWGGGRSREGRRCFHASCLICIR